MLCDSICVNCSDVEAVDDVDLSSVFCLLGLLYVNSV